MKIRKKENKDECKSFRVETGKEEDLVSSSVLCTTFAQKRKRKLEDIWDCKKNDPDQRQKNKIWQMGLERGKFFYSENDKRQSNRGEEEVEKQQKERTKGEGGKKKNS